MNKKRNKISFSTIGSLFFLICIVISAFSAVIMTVVEASIVINETPSFSGIDTYGNKYYCYEVGGRSDSVAIAWAGTPESTPETLNVSSTLTADSDGGGGTYNIIAVARGGFSRCDFVTINLPQTIEEIREGAFAHCENLSTFQFPCLVEKIDASAFMDCLSLTTVSYTKRDGTEGNYTYTETNTNDKISRIEEHAFDSCSSLIQFDCPESVTYFGKSCFQRCAGFTRFYFPSKTMHKVNGVDTQKYDNVTIDSYAFADCSNLVWVYFEENLTSVSKYAFVDCQTSMVFHFGYSASRSNPEFGGNNLWRRKSLKDGDTSVYNYESTHILIYTADGYPGLKIGIENTDVYLNSWHKDNTYSPTNTIKLIDANSTGSYAVIYQWNNPGRTVTRQGDTFTYYNYGTGELTIPAYVTYNNQRYPVKIIKEEAFSQKGSELVKIHFASKDSNSNKESNLVQICKKAFYKSNSISELDFDGVTTLKEISSCVFSDFDSKSVKMDKVTSLALPASLQYLGKYAFYNFTKVQSLSFTTYSDDHASTPRHSQLMVMGGYSFGKIGYDYNAGKFDVVLPCTLNDEEALKASVNWAESGDYNEQNWAAIGPYTFGGARDDRTAVKSITMEECEHSEHSSIRTSLAPNAFARSRFLTRFVANSNLCLIGADAFKDCERIKEAFLTTTKAQSYVDDNPSKPYVWGTKDLGATFNQSLFSGVTLPNLIIYLDGPAPGGIKNMSTDSDDMAQWNSESLTSASFLNEAAFEESPDYTKSADKNRHTQGRSTIPTLYNIDFDFSEGSVLYWKPPKQNVAASFMATPPTTDAEYFQGVIVFARGKNSSDYTAVRYFCQNSTAQEEIDLSSISYSYTTTDGEEEEIHTINVSSNLKTIGPEAFASDSISTNANVQAPAPGKYFVLPSGVKTISERAFYRRAGTAADSVSNNGVRIVTYHNGTSIQGDYESTKTNWNTNKYGYCNVANVTKIERDAFYNNNFKSVQLNGSLTFLGKSAFYTHYGSASRSKLDSITFASTNAYFDIENGGLYYEVAAKKTLLYQIQGINQYTNGTENVLDIASDTKAIGMAACANTKYTTVNLNSDLTHIYGSAFHSTKNLTTVTGGSSLKYISAIASGVNGYKVGKQSELDSNTTGTVAIGSTSSSNEIKTTGIDGRASIKTLYPYSTTQSVTLYSENTTITKDSVFYSVEILDDEVLGMDDTLPFDYVDFRSAARKRREYIESSGSAFQSSGLTTINFTSMTDLRKIGHGAFKNCSNLSVTNGGVTYKYYSYDSSTHTVSLSATKTDGAGVLDLSMCTKLSTIGNNAFAGCSSIKYAHLPNTNGKIYIAHDPDSPWVTAASNTDNIELTIFGNIKNITVLIGDSVFKANNSIYTEDSIKNHYNTSKCFAGMTSIYYSASSSSDISQKNTAGSVKYWTTNSTKIPNGYILFENKAQAEDYFTHLTAGDITWPS